MTSIPATLEIAQLVELVQTAPPERVVEHRNALVDLDSVLARRDRAKLLDNRRQARVTEWWMAHRWPVLAAGGARGDDRPTLIAFKVGDNDRLWHNIYIVGQADWDWLLTEDDPDRLTQAAVIRIVTEVASDDEWYTPRWLFDALGVTFDLDVCAPEDRTHVSVPAARFYTAKDDGLIQPWDGLVWCNPPYSDSAPWAQRMIDHGNGLFLSHVPINGLWCLRAWNACSNLRLLQGMEFVRPNGRLQRPAWWLQLVAFGDTAATALQGMMVADEVRERFHPSRLLV